MEPAARREQPTVPAQGVVFRLQASVSSREPLFRKDSEGPTLLALMACDVVPPSTRRQDADADWDALITGAVRREPGDRFPTASAMIAALSEIAAAHEGPCVDELAGLVNELMHAPPPADDEIPTKREASDDIPTRLTRDAAPPRAET